MVIGSRLLRDRAIAGGMPRWKWLGNRMLTGIENRAFGVELSEYHTGYRAFSADLLRSIPFLRNSDDFVFDQQIFAQVLARDARVVEVPIPTRYFREASSVDLRTSVRYGLHDPRRARALHGRSPPRPLAAAAPHRRRPRRPAPRSDARRPRRRARRGARRRGARAAHRLRRRHAGLRPAPRRGRLRRPRALDRPGRGVLQDARPRPPDGLPPARLPVLPGRRLPRVQGRPRAGEGPRPRRADRPGLRRGPRSSRSWG